MKVKESCLLLLWTLLVNVVCAQSGCGIPKHCKSSPPPLQHVAGPTEVCFGNSILLEATPTDSRYYLRWEPLDTSSTLPVLAEGNSVTFSYGFKAIRGIAVRQVDKVTGCQSEAYIHPVDTFSLSNGRIPGMMTVHEGDLIHLELPDQSAKVVYKWTTSDGGASIVGDNFSPSVDVLVNYLDFGNVPRYPHRTYVTLERKCCGGAEVRQEMLLSIEKNENADTLSATSPPLAPDSSPAPVIDSVIAPKDACQDRPVMFRTVARGVHLRYRWDFGDGTFNYGNPIYHSYRFSSTMVTLTVTDTFGRAATKHTYLTMSPDPYEHGSLMAPIRDRRLCSTKVGVIYYNPPIVTSNYRWLPADTLTRNNVAKVTKTGDYMVYVEADYSGCRTGEIVNFGFPNAPEAEIVGDTLCKVGDKVMLLGNTGSLNTYFWKITGPKEFTFDTPNIVFKPRKAGLYHVSLTVTSENGCTAEAECEVRVVTTEGKVHYLKLVKQ